MNNEKLEACMKSIYGAKELKGFKIDKVRFIVWKHKDFDVILKGSVVVEDLSMRVKKIFKFSLSQGCCFRIRYIGIESGLPDYSDQLFSYLIQGYQIGWMDLNEHFNVWMSLINKMPSNEKGFQKYLEYCKRNDVNVHQMVLLGMKPINNLMRLYREENQGYEIVDEVSIGEHSVVLGYRKHPGGFVTWETAANRSTGFNFGNYFESFDRAYQDFKERSHSLLDSYLIIRQNHDKEYINMNKQGVKIKLE